jgi:hypothetical protein
MPAMQLVPILGILLFLMPLFWDTMVTVASLPSSYDWEISGAIQCGVRDSKTGQLVYSNLPGARVELWEDDCTDCNGVEQCELFMFLDNAYSTT